MAQIFHPSMNTVAKASIFGFLFVVAALAWAIAGIDASPYNTEAFVARNQPVPFSHEHHVSGLGIDCRFCHATVEESSFAGMPSTKTCMTCHSKMWTNAAMLEPVRASWATGTPIQWNRVYHLPGYVYFNHSIHVNKGVGCTTCHGPIDRMPLVWRAASLRMQWCVECHRQPEKYVRPRERVFDVTWVAPKDQEALGRELVKEYDIPVKRMTDCYVCHR